jgi:hypothetical protein
MAPFEWDARQAGANRRKHGIAFADVVLVFEDEQALSMKDDIGAVDEPHLLALGRDALGRLVVVAYRRRGERIRIVSARRATATERRQYRGGER